MSTLIQIKKEPFMISIISFPGNIKILLSYNPYHTRKLQSTKFSTNIFPEVFQVSPKCQVSFAGSNAGPGSNSPWPKGQLSSGSNTRGQSLKFQLRRRVESLKVYVLQEIEMRSCGVGHCVRINEVKVISRNEIE